MNPITEARSDVKAALLPVVGPSVYDYFPERLQTDTAAVITPGDPYVVPGKAFGDYDTNLSVVVMVRSKDNEVVTKALDELIVNALDALRVFGVVQAQKPHVEDSFKPTLYLACEITIKTTYRKDLD